MWEGIKLHSLLRTNLINARKALKLSHTSISSKVEISRSYYTQIENGYKTPSMEVAEKIAKLLNKTIDELFCTSTNK